MKLSPAALLQATGYLGLFLIVYVESGLLIGFFLPGDSLLFAAGFLASQGFLNIWLVIPLIFVAAVLGDSTGYHLGKRFGPRIFNRDAGRLLNKEHIRRSEDFYARHGGKTIIIARFVPIVRTFAPVLAGVGKMTYRQFITYNIVGGFIWAVSVPLLGYFLGNLIPNIEHYLLPIIAGIILLSISPSIWHLIKHPKERDRIIAWVKQRIKNSKIAR